VHQFVIDLFAKSVAKMEEKRDFHERINEQKNGGCNKNEVQVV
jgi:hypothetical protein